MIRSKIKHHYPASYIPWESMKQLVYSLIGGEQKEKRLGLYIALGAFLGLRHSDLIRFSWKDLNSDEIYMNERKTGKERILTISPELRNIINICKPSELFDDDIKIFANGQKALTPQGLNQQFKKLKEKYKLDEVKYMSLHSPRKTFGRRVWETNNYSDAALIKLSEIFRHSSVFITRKYLGISEEEIKNCYLNL